ncbi:uncharacterized protein BO80DRAFT_179862 [Aspergillus ibericus CBS 121593]|uniref:Ig-like domain-containing protein n=1 Tax=Aspergillus ibericus CBS 121593 TaxID=1448316 RepID=A0A395GQY7_9EURO|nr:hypothetical protein BO80DRAFT_179862 [Aspergillus ibericus CBS 121593]RAK97951.1 hypothetical protein BO80DRAFT_179862 [Aspergillus ibericus CBS 121593]
MKSFTTILLTALLSATSLATPSLDDHTIVPMTYTGPITPGGQHMPFTGDSIQEIHSQIKALNPDFELTDNSAVTKRKSSDSDSDSDTKGNLICNIPGRFSDTAQTFWIRSGIKYLKGLEGKCGVSKGPKSCARISCSYNAGIFLCNDEELHVKCSDLADYANDIIERCDEGEYVNGQEFDDGNWNIVVAESLC